MPRDLLDNSPRDLLEADNSMNTSGPRDLLESSNPSAGGIAKQFGIGFGNEALLGLPLYALEKAKGEDARKALESNVPVERIARGVGTTVGMATYVPARLFGLGLKGAELGIKAFKGAKAYEGVKTAVEGIVGAEKASKALKFGENVVKGGVATGTFELVHAPQDSYKEKIVTVPTATLFGGALFGVGSELAKPIQRFLENKGLIKKGLVDGGEDIKKLNTLLDGHSVEDGSVKLKTQKIGNFLETRLVDTKAPIRNITEMAEQVSGKAIEFGDDPYKLARNFSGIADKVQYSYIEPLKGILNKNPSLVNPTKQLLLAERMLERAQRGFDNPKGITADGAINIMSDLKNSLGDESYKKLQGITSEIRGLTKTALSNLKDAGVITQESFDNIIAKNEFYTPFDVLEHMYDTPEKFARGSGLNVSKPGFLKGLEGTTKEIDDPLNSITKYLFKSAALAEKNKVVTKLVNLRGMSSKMEDVIIPLKKAENVRERISIFSDLKELLPLRNKTERLIRTRDKRLYRLITEIDKLEQQGLNTSLKIGKNFFGRDFHEERLIKTHPRNITTDVSGVEIPGKAQVEVFHNVPDRISDSDYKKFIENFMELPTSEVEKIKSKLLTRGKKLPKLIDEIVNLRDELSSVKSNIFDLRSRAGDIKNVDVYPSNYDKIYVYKDGIKEEYAVPQELADAVKGMNNESIDLMTKIASFSSRALRAGATTFSIPFVFKNMIRDAQTASIVSKVGFSPVDWVKGFAEALGRGKDFELFMKSGGGMAGMVENIRGKNVAEKLVPSISDKILKTTNPLNWIANASETGELVTRLGVFKRGLKLGMKPEEAAFNARNATVDFAKSGSMMKIINMWVPFINARTQGFVNLAQTLKTNPKRFALTGTAIVGMPLISTYVWNTKNFPDVWDDIRQFEKNDNFIFIYGREKDKDGKYTNVAMIPKGDIGKVLGNPIEAFLEHQRGQNPQSYEQMAVQVLSSLSPIEFARNGQISGQALASGLTPPAIKGGLETAFNVNFYTGRPIVPDNLKQASPRNQYTNKTPAMAVYLGNLINVSPMKLQNLAGTLFGGLGKQILDPTQITQGLGRSFGNAYGGQSEQEQFSILEDIVRDTEDKDANDLRLLKQSLEDWSSIPPVPELRRQFINSRFGDNRKLVEKFAGMLSAESSGEKPIDRLVRSRPVRDRIKYIKQSTLFMSDEEKMQFLKRMVDLKIINLSSDETIKALKELE